MTGTESELTLHNGEVYSGEFKDGKLEGEGVVEYRGGEKRKEGMFSRGLLNGEGSIKMGNITYSGHFMNDELNGKGLIKENGKIIYVGSLLNFKPHG